MVNFKADRFSQEKLFDLSTYQCVHMDTADLKQRCQPEKVKIQPGDRQRLGSCSK